MYDELVKRLRNRRICIQQSGDLEDFPLLKEAADAIEGLSAQLLEMGQAGKFLLDAHKINCKMIDPDTIPTDSEWWAKYKALLELLYIPRWIPVTERLPEETNHYFVRIEYKCDGELPSKWTQVAWFCKKFYWEHSHCAEFFEETVTHWMPLPEPPKEE